MMDRLDHAMQVAIALEKGGLGRHLNIRTLSRAIGYDMDLAEGQAAVLVRALVTIGGLCVRGEEAGHHPAAGINRMLEDDVGEVCLAVPDEVKRIDAIGTHSIAGELLDMADRAGSSCGS